MHEAGAPLAFAFIVAVLLETNFEAGDTSAFTLFGSNQTIGRTPVILVTVVIPKQFEVGVVLASKSTAISLRSRSWCRGMPSLCFAPTFSHISYESTRLGIILIRDGPC